MIIGGTNKAGTTSVFRYLCDHPQVCGSSIKETGFFLSQIDQDISIARRDYDAFFRSTSAKHKIKVEASTGYLAHSDIVVPQLRRLQLSPKMLFILRNPIDRLWSYYNFHVGQLSIGKSVEFEQFVDAAIEYERTNINRLPEIDVRHLRSIAYGRYFANLKSFIDDLGAPNVKVMFFDDLKLNPLKFLTEVANFAAIEPEFYSTYEFFPANRSFTSKIAWLHALALSANRNLESVLNRLPKLKRLLVAGYKMINMQDHSAGQPSASVQLKLAAYYEDDLKCLCDDLNIVLPASWT